MKTITKLMTTMPSVEPGTVRSTGVGVGATTLAVTRAPGVAWTGLGVAVWGWRARLEVEEAKLSSNASRTAKTSMGRNTLDRPLFMPIVSISPWSMVSPLEGRTSLSPYAIAQKIIIA